MAVDICFPRCIRTLFHDILSVAWGLPSGGLLSAVTSLVIDVLVANT